MQEASGESGTSGLSGKHLKYLNVVKNFLINHVTGTLAKALRIFST